MDYTIIKAVQTSNHQADVRYGTYRGIQCSHRSFASVIWTLFISPRLWDKFDLDCKLGKRGVNYLNLLANLDILGKKTFH